MWLEFRRVLFRSRAVWDPGLLVCAL